MDDVKTTMRWDVDIPVGLPLQAQIAGDETRFNCLYLGMKPGEFLILQMPNNNGLKERLVGRCTLVVRFMRHGTVYGFKAMVSGYLLKPRPLIFLGYPASLETLNLRKCERVDTFIEAEGEIGTNLVRGVILDMSANGCKFVIDRTTGMRWPELPPGTTILLKFTLPHSKEYLELDTEVAMLSDESDRAQVGLRFRFSKETQKSQRSLEGFVRHVLSFLKVRR